MTKIILPALLILGCLGSAQASIEVWNKDGNKLSINGRVVGLNYLADKDQKLHNVKPEGDNSTARFGFTGMTQITDSLSGFGRAEWETNTGTNTNVNNRYAYAGLNFSKWGSIDYGHSDGIVKYVTAQVDIMPEFPSSPVDNSLYILSARSKKILTYRNQDFFYLVDGLNFGIQYADEDRDAPINRGEAYGVGFEYTILNSDFTVSGAYAKSSGYDSKRTWGAGLRYNDNQLYAAAIFVENKIDKEVTSDVKYQGFDILVQYRFDFEVGSLTPSFTYSQHKNKTSGINNNTLIKFIELGAAYDFNKNFRALIDYKINLLDSDDVGANGTGVSGEKFKPNTKDVVALGLIYSF